MAPRLYTASIVGKGVPVDEIEKVEKVKKPRQKKEKSVEPAPEDGANISTEEKPDKEKKPEKEKKPRTEKQIAAAERMVEARRLKKEQRDKEAAEVLAKAEEEKKKVADKEAAKEAKKEAAKEKRRQSKLLKATTNTTASGIAVENTDGDHPMEDVQTPEKPRKRKSDDDSPPKWLPTLISAIKSETGHTGSMKKLKEEAHAEAAEKWSDPLVRDRVNVIHNKAGEQVTNAIFPGRTFVRR